MRPNKNPNRSNRKELWEKRIRTHEEIPFLTRKQRLSKELLRLFRICYDYARGFYAFRKVSRCVTVFGSSRFGEDHPFYRMARELGQLLAEQDYMVMTGGGPGLMEATNRGAKERNGVSIGCNIDLVTQESPNHYLDHWFTFHYFFVRKLMLTKYSSTFVILPGGFGTLDELFEMATLIQTERLYSYPIVLMGTEFWKPLIDYMHEMLVSHGTIDVNDADLFFLTNSPREAVEYIKFAHRRYSTHFN